MDHPAKPSKASPLAEALRAEILEMCKDDVLDLDQLYSLAAVALHGRELLSVRDPASRFDAPTGVQVDCTPYGPRFSRNGWNGPVAKRADHQRAAYVKTAIQKSPVARALRWEILEVARSDPFGATTLVQIQQLAVSGAETLVAILGLGDPMNVEMCPGPFVAPAGAYQGNGVSSTSSETFGANFGRELVAAVSKLASLANDKDPEPPKEPQADAMVLSELER